MARKPGGTGRPASYEDLLALPEHVVGEIVDGELVVSPRSAPAHALASSRLGTELGGPFDRGRGGPGGWWLLDEPELHLGPDVLVPDLAGWRRERMPRLPTTAFFELPPDWACEVISPSSARVDRAQKVRIYARHRVPWVWLVDPLARTVEVLTLDDGRYVLTVASADEKVRLPPFDAIELELSALWEPEEPPSAP
jgi:Uma2 family endonuclease